MLKANNMKLNKCFGISKPLLAVLLLGAVALTSGCTTVGRALQANYGELGDKVVRLRIYQYGYGYSKVESTDVARKRIDGMPWLRIFDDPAPTSDMILPYRWVYVVAPGQWDAATFWGNGAQGWAQAQVADNVPLLHEGDWVDVYVPKSPLSVGKHRFLTIVKLVCKHDDKVCQKNDPIGKAKGQVVPGARYSMETLSFTPHYDMSGDWLPGKKPARP